MTTGNFGAEMVWQPEGEALDIVPTDLCLVTTYFNPARFRRKLQRYLDFASRAAAGGLRLFTVECVFRESEFEIQSVADVIRVRAGDPMWQKERLLNLAVRRLPRQFTKIVVIDFDVIFENPEWALETSRMLDDVPLVQPFETAIWLQKDATSDDGTGLVFPSIASRNAADATCVAAGDFAAHGVPGYAWGIRRDLLERHGLYDACVIGGGDHLIAHAACGDWTSPCFDWSIGIGTVHHRHFVRWAGTFYGDVRGMMGFVPGRVLHLWHGQWKERRYTSRHLQLRKFEFDPDLDIKAGSDGCWEWSSDKPELRDAVAAYFANRQEDGDAD